MQKFHTDDVSLPSEIVQSVCESFHNCDKGTLKDINPFCSQSLFKF